ncbi:hypothetical protein B0F90DRAFT_1814863 [Multifurca ochricompacta]|uniref:Uncharacterized protein n=1 Tax=Multifurca ochricompacta TaxID=376703 RepID=A0AAD4M918_9AGAM|nr:hypothetical protein B0F90DRAFT_1814863 [Multifurca ochricompacta]
MTSPIRNTTTLSELIKANLASLIQEHLRPIVDELAAQHRTLLTHSALLTHNHNVNDYQMARLENLRNLEQSINFKVAGALAFDPWQHPTIGTNLREPVPADPRLIPQFPPLESATPAQRAAESATLVAQAGISARRLGVPLTLHDFPCSPATHGETENEDPMHSSVPLFGLRAPRWRVKEGLPLDEEPGLATYDGVPALPSGKKGRKLYAKKLTLMRKAASANTPSRTLPIPGPASALTRLPTATPVVLSEVSPQFALETSTEPFIPKKASGRSGPTTSKRIPSTSCSKRSGASQQQHQCDKIKQEGSEPESKRRRRSAAPNVAGPNISLILGSMSIKNSSGPGQQQLRRSARIARTSKMVMANPTPKSCSSVAENIRGH